MERSVGVPVEWRVVAEVVWGLGLFRSREKQRLVSVVVSSGLVESGSAGFPRLWSRLLVFSLSVFAVSEEPRSRGVASVEVEPHSKATRQVKARRQ